MSESDFRAICQGHGLPQERLVTIKGFFSDGLGREETNSVLSGSKAAIVYVDVDTYSPATEVLAFIGPYLQRGSVIVFDDWNCFYADNSLGERRAWHEYLCRHPDLTFSPFVETHLAASFVCLGDSSSRKS
jgi:hypothetical protein